MLAREIKVFTEVVLLQELLCNHILRQNLLWIAKILCTTKVSEISGGRLTKLTR